MVTPISPLGKPENRLAASMEKRSHTEPPVCLAWIALRLAPSALRPVLDAYPVAVTVGVVVGVVPPDVVTVTDTTLCPPVGRPTAASSGLLLTVAVPFAPAILLATIPPPGRLPR